ncbi:MAG: serine hydrolase [Bacteroidetes bacterium]|nr:serine hydrolase [Bacteroidota bacterium]
MTKTFFLLSALVVLFTHLNAQNSNAAEEKNITSLIAQFSSADPFVQGDAVTQIVRYGEKAVIPLIRSLSDSTTDLRICSAIALGKIAPKGLQAIPALTLSLSDKKSDVRWCSAVALGYHKQKATSATKDLVRLLSDDDRSVRWAAYTSLQAIDKNALNTPHKLSEIIDQLEHLTPEVMKELNVPGVSISLIKENSAVWSKGFGVADKATMNGVTSSTVFEACSMSKPVFSFVVLQLADLKKLDLDKPLYQYLPEQFVSADEEYAKLISARMVLTHTSGMPNWRKAGDERNAPIPLYFKPGTKFNYSGEGMFYLQRVVEHITKEPLASLAQRMLFDKLGLHHTGFVWTGALDPYIAAGHDDSGKRKERNRYLRGNAAYTLYTTPDEYARIIINIMRPGPLLSSAMRNEMLSHQFRSDVREVTDRPGKALGLFSFRGLGWAIDSTITGNIVYHSGSNQTGFRCYSQFDPQNGTGIVIMTNGDNGSELWQRLVSIIGDL